MKSTEKSNSAPELPQSNLPSPTDMERSAYHQTQRQEPYLLELEYAKYAFTRVAPAWSIFAAHMAHACICHRYNLHESIKNSIPLLAGITQR